MVGAERVTGHGSEESLAAALAEIVALREENERLRGLLGLSTERSAEPPVAWEPTLFTAPQAQRLAVDRRSSPASRAEIDLASYDRLFPSQDFVPKDSFGNLIALPLQGECRKRGTTLFLDPTTLYPYDDQWAFLSSLPLASPEALQAIAEVVRPLPVGGDAVEWERQRDA